MFAATTASSMGAQTAHSETLVPVVNCCHWVTTLAQQSVLLHSGQPPACLLSHECGELLVYLAVTLSVCQGISTRLVLYTSKVDSKPSSDI